MPDEHERVHVCGDGDACGIYRACGVCDACGDDVCGIGSGDRNGKLGYKLGSKVAETVELQIRQTPCTN